MSTANEYRQFADECVRSARDAEKPETTAAFLSMAQTWRAAALRIESSIVWNVPTPRDRPDSALLNV